MELFRLLDKDFTSCITVPNYTVNETPIYDEWTDANYRIHRFIKRRKIKGSFSLKFFNLEDYEDFLSKYELASGQNRDGSVNASFYVNNLKTVKVANVFMTFEAPDLIPVVGTPSNKEITVNIEEV